MAKHYVLNCGQYVLTDGERPIGRPLDRVSLCIHKTDGFLQKHGDPERVENWHARETAKLRDSGMHEFANEFVVVSGRFPVDEVNRCLANHAYAGVFYKGLLDGSVEEMPIVAPPPPSADGEGRNGDSMHRRRHTF